MIEIKILTLPEAAKVLSVHPQTLRQMVKKGKIPYLQFNRYYRFRVSDLVRWLESQLRGAT